jgi:hypothetical protein
VKHAKDQEQIVRRMFQNETIPAEKQLEILEEELQRIKKRLNEKHPQTSASEFTSESDSPMTPPERQLEVSSSRSGRPLKNELSRESK